MIRLLVRGAGGVMAAAAVAASGGASPKQIPPAPQPHGTAGTAILDAPDVYMMKPRDLARAAMGNIAEQSADAQIGYSMQPFPSVMIMFKPHSSVYQGVCEQTTLQADFEAAEAGASRRIDSQPVRLATPFTSVRYWWAADANLIYRSHADAAEDDICTHSRPRQGGITIAGGVGTPIVILIERAAREKFTELSDVSLSVSYIHPCVMAQDDVCGSISFYNHGYTRQVDVKVDHARLEFLGSSTQAPRLISLGTVTLSETAMPQV